MSANLDATEAMLQEIINGGNSTPTTEPAEQSNVAEEVSAPVEETNNATESVEESYDAPAIDNEPLNKYKVIFYVLLIVGFIMLIIAIALRDWGLLPLSILCWSFAVAYNVLGKGRE